MPAACPAGKIRRKAYTRQDGTHVRSTCVPDKGLPGKTPARRKVLPVPVKGNLSKFGYHNVKSTPAAVRHTALRRAVKAAGYATIIRRINLVANYNKRSDPRVHDIMRRDIRWIQKNLAQYSKTAQRNSGTKTIRKSTRKISKKVPVKAGSVVSSGRQRQLWRLPGSTSKFYQYRKQNGGMGRRYI